MKGQVDVMSSSPSYSSPFIFSHFFLSSPLTCYSLHLACTSSTKDKKGTVLNKSETKKAYENKVNSIVC